MNIDGIQVLVSEVLPNSTMVVSPDIYRIFQGLPSISELEEFEAKIKVLSDLIKKKEK